LFAAFVAPLWFLCVDLLMLRKKLSIKDRAKRVRLLLMDVDGVLTDGHIWLMWAPDGAAHEVKGFSAHDGVRLKLARAAGLRTGVITGRESRAMTRRAQEVDLEFVYQKQPEKLLAYLEILGKTGLKDEQVCYVGDDLPDLPILERAGFSVAVANASREAKAAAHFVTKASGGNGAVSEVIELILKTQGKWRQILADAKS
jgi:3-deoxy-D-manno-octulosonate 8-phosphate phosphatase (KDO 8-P phosphatase)